MYTILIIEDDNSVKSNLKDILEFKNYSVISASNGIEGLDAAKKHLPDLIICDILMPGLDGYKVKEELSKGEKTSIIPFIFLTAKSSHADIRKGMNTGADDYIPKPYEIKELLEAIETRLKRFNEMKSSDKTNVKNKLDAQDRILIENHNKTSFIYVKDIILIEADGNYSKVHLSNGKNEVLRKLLKEWEELLPENTFLRIHRQKIVNLNFVDRIEKYFNRTYLLHLKNYPEPLQTSYRFASKLKSILKV